MVQLSKCFPLPLGRATSAVMLLFVRWWSFSQGRTSLSDQRQGKSSPPRPIGLCHGGQNERF
jgi:hypothetical protein